MRIALLATVALLFSFVAHASDINCGGKVVWVMADHPGCSGNMAFKTDGAGGQGGVWMCTKSKEGNAVVMAALLADKAVNVYIEGSDVGGVCTSLPGYRLISYVIINP